MNGLQWALLAGGLVGSGLALILWRLAPAQPDLRDMLARLDRRHRTERSDTDLRIDGLQDRLGVWVLQHTPLASLVGAPARELAILRKPVHRFYGEKAAFFLAGIVVPVVLTALLLVIGLRPPGYLPVGATLVIAVALSFLPDYNARSDAARARDEFARALGSYIDLVALECRSGSQPRQAMENAAAVGDSWVFQRIGEELARSRWSGRPPWDGLQALAGELGLPDLADFSDIMRLSGTQGSAVYHQLRARSASMRNSLLASEVARANAVGERMSMPVSALAVVFMLLLATPPLLRIVFGT